MRTLFILPFFCFSHPLFADDPPTACLALPHRACTSDNINPPIGANEVCVATGDLQYSVSLTNYPSIITSALTGNPLNGNTPIVVPTCIAETHGTNWGPLTPFDKGKYSLTITLTGPTAPDVIGLSDFTLKIPLASDSTYYLGGKYSYCPCGFATSSGCSSSAVPLGWPLNTPISHVFYFPPSALDANNLGYCANNNTQGYPDNNGGAFLFYIYTKNGQIPPVGTYTTTLDITATAEPAMSP